VPILFLSLGSNIDPAKNLRACARLLRREFPEIAFSHVYETAPRDREDQPAFLNAVARMETDQTPYDVSRCTQFIERKLGKRPPYPKGPRTIDIDLLFVTPPISSNSTLTLPHPRMHERRFVLEPLCELTDPDTKHPTLRRTWRELLRENMDQECLQTGLAL